MCGDQTVKTGETGRSHAAAFPARSVFIAWGLLCFCSVAGSQFASAEIFDSLDAYPPRWRLDTSDCNARVIDQKNLPSAGVDGGGCESFTFKAGLGSEAILVYPIEPVHAINDLVAVASVRSARKGARIGVRVRFPYLRDPNTHRPVAKIIYGATYDRPGKFQSLGIGKIERELRILVANIRANRGADADVDDAYVDAVAINAYSGRGVTTLQLDQLSVRGLVPVGDHGRVSEVAADSDGVIRRARMLEVNRPSSAPTDRSTVDVSQPFPQTRLIRILEHQGEPLTWVRTLGFDAVLLSKPPTAALLRDAIATGLLVYAPPPLAPDPAIQTLLDPVMAWYLGGGVALDGSRIEQTDATVRRLRAMPTRWQRPILIAPVESWRSYSQIADGIVTDAMPRGRELPAGEQSLAMQQRRARIGVQTPFAIAVDSSVPLSLARMNDSIEDTIGAPPSTQVAWHALLAQTMLSLEQGPRALVFRSSGSLASGSNSAHQRSMALSYINRFVAMVAPWLITSEPSEPYRVDGAAYRCGRLESGGTDFLFLTSDQTIGPMVLAGDGRAISVLLPPSPTKRTAWRLTDFSVTRVEVKDTPSGGRLEIVSPDIAELLVVSSDATLGARLSQSVQRFAEQAAADRWQLCGEQMRQVRAAWENSITSGATEALMPIDLLTAAERTHREAETFYRSGDHETTLRLSRRTDAWATRARASLHQALLPKSQAGSPFRFVSCPPLAEGRMMLQVGWRPLMEDDGWSENLIASGGLDQPSVLSPGQWTFGQRVIGRASSQAGWVSRGYFDGTGAIRLATASTSQEPLGGGYEGTMAMLSSPAVSVSARQAIRIDAMIRTIGFGGPHQGVLIYDSLGGQEMGVLVRAASDWTPVRLYRQSIEQADVRVMFEIIGDGEAVVDEVGLRVWKPDPLPELPLRNYIP